MSLKSDFTDFVYDLQDEICLALEELEPEERFREDLWDRDGGGGGRTRVLSGGSLIEKGGVNVSAVHGELPEAIRENFKVDKGWFYATGISLVLHPKSPLVPVVHANFRFFELYDDEKMKISRDCWFGGGADLTPYYLFDEDAVHFHTTLKAACDRHGKELYPRFKQECDRYFYNAHRQEARGIGGLFFDYLRSDGNRTAQEWYDFTTDVGRQFTEAYIPIVQRRMEETWTPRQRYWQEIRRGRYVEFNLIHDRGTRFGLKTNGRVESILMSLPPRVRWVYDFHPESGSPESYLLEHLARPVDWVSISDN